MAAKQEQLARLCAELTSALRWALPSARLDVERLRKALSSPSITPSMMEEYTEARIMLDMAESALTKANRLAGRVEH